MAMKKQSNTPAYVTIEPRNRHHEISDALATDWFDNPDKEKERSSCPGKNRMIPAKIKKRTATKFTSVLLEPYPFRSNQVRVLSSSINFRRDIDLSK